MNLLLEKKKKKKSILCKGIISRAKYGSLGFVIHVKKKN